MTTTLKLTFVALSAACAVSCATQSPATYDGAVTLTLENDMFTGSDNSYTNGFGVSWVSAGLDTYDDDQFVSNWGEFWSFLPGVPEDGSNTYAAWSLVQEMHAPDDITDPNPPESDQPYAGILYVDSVLYAQSEHWGHAWELKLGIVGPAAQAEHVQKWVHERTGSDEPQGWDTQLPNEPVINVGYTVAHLWCDGRVGDEAEWRLVPIGTAGLGTYFTGVGLGMYGEVGWNLVDALGASSLRAGLNAASTIGVGPIDGWSVAFFGGFGGYGVVHYLPLDGTVFKDSRSVDTKPFVGTGSLGVALRHGRLALSLAASYSTKAFDGQEEAAEFGTLSLSWYF